jgi:CDP-diacylglycerol--glycerol-3-phosphate 3-phosphatidyltransferase
VSGPEAMVTTPGGGTSGYKESLKRFAHGVLDPLVRGLLAIGIGADHLTALGFALSLSAALAFATGRFRYAAALVTLAGVCDILDGQVARQSGKVTRFGAFLDSTLDRVAEAALFVGLAFYYSAQLVDMTVNPSRVIRNFQQDNLEPVTFLAIAMTAVLALVGSFMVSYTRARAEGLGLECKVGWFERPERLVLLIIAGFFGLGPVIPAALLLLVVFSFTTAIQRMVHVWKITRPAGAGSSEV